MLLCHQSHSIYLWLNSCNESGLLTHWGWVTHICVVELAIIGSDNSLSPGRRQAIIWTNAGILLIGPLGTNFTVILIEILLFSFKKMRLKVSSAKWRPFCLSLNVLNLVSKDDSLKLSLHKEPRIIFYWNHVFCRCFQVNYTRHISLFLGRFKLKYILFYYFKRVCTCPRKVDNIWGMNVWYL